MTDVVTEHWREIIAKGGIVNNPCTRSTTNVVAGGGYYSALVLNVSNHPTYWNNSGSATLYEAQLFGNTPLKTYPIVDIAPLIAAAKQSAIARIDSTPYSFLEDAFELRETLRFLRNPVLALKNVSRAYNGKLNKIRQKKGYGQLDKVQAISDLWLQYRFAFTPLVRSLMDGYNAFSTIGKKQVVTRRTARARTEDSKFTNESEDYHFSASVYDQFDHNSSNEVVVRAGILYDISNPVHSVPSLLGLRSKNIPETFWAVMPYSFMVDRVYNLSKMIAGLANLADPSVSQLAGWYSVTQKTFYSNRFSGQVNPGTSVTVNGDVVSVKNETYTRTPWTATVKDTLPPLNKTGLIRDATSIADLLALSYRFLK
jgi:hypothetical protein